MGLLVRRELVLIRREDHDAMCEPLEFWFREANCAFWTNLFPWDASFPWPNSLQPPRTRSCGSRAGLFLGFSLSIVIIPCHLLHLLPGLSDAIPPLIFWELQTSGHGVCAGHGARHGK